MACLLRAAARLYHGCGPRKEADQVSFIKPCLQEGFFDVFHIYNIRHERRDELKTYLAEHGIQTEIHYPVPPHRQKALQGMFDINAYPLADKIHATTLSLPISICSSEEDIEQVIAVINCFSL